MLAVLLGRPHGRRGVSAGQCSRRCWYRARLTRKGFPEQRSTESEIDSFTSACLGDSGTIVMLYTPAWQAKPSAPAPPPHPARGGRKAMWL